MDRKELAPNSNCCDCYTLNYQKKKAPFDNHNEVLIVHHRDKWDNYTFQSYPQDN